MVICGAAQLRDARIFVERWCGMMSCLAAFFTSGVFAASRVYLSLYVWLRGEMQAIHCCVWSIVFWRLTCMRIASYRFPFPGIASWSCCCCSSTASMARQYGVAPPFSLAYSCSRGCEPGSCTFCAVLRATLCLSHFWGLVLMTVCKKTTGVLCSLHDSACVCMCELKFCQYLLFNISDGVWHI